VDDFTRKLLAVAFDEIVQESGRKRRRRGDVTQSDLRSRLWACYWAFRDGLIERWASRILASCSPERLAAKVETVDCLLIEAEEYWDVPEDDEDPTQWVAYGLAYLRWLNLDHTDRAPRPRCSEAELAAWLRQKKKGPAQLGLFGETAPTESASPGGKGTSIQEEAGKEAGMLQTAFAI
jgi:hypothetical protein